MKPLILSLLPFALLAQTRGTFVGNLDFSGGSAATVTMTGWNLAASGTAVGCARWAGGPTSISSISDTAGNTWSITTPLLFQSGNYIAAFYANNTMANASDTVSINFPSAASFTAESVVQYSGTATSAIDVVNVTGTAASGPTVSTSTTFSTSQALEVIAACATSAASTVAGQAGTLSMTPAAHDASYVEAIVDTNTFTQQSGITATVTATGVNNAWGLQVLTIKSSNAGIPPTLTQAFSGADASIGGVPYVYQGQGATVTFTAGNPNVSTTLNGIGFSDTLPSNMVVATPSGLGGTCTGSSATAGSSTIALSGLSLAGGASCTIIVNVTSTGSGQGLNTTGVISSTTTGAGIGPTSSATLTMFGTPSITISNITIQPTPNEHSSINVRYTLSSNGYCQVQFGTASGVYARSGGTGGLTTTCGVTLGGLAPNTNYYIMPTGRTTSNSSPWTAGVCQIGASCGSVEQGPLLTATLPNPHPAAPIPPTTWTPVEPNVSAYTVVPMQAAATSGTDTQMRSYVIGDCVAAANISAQTNWLSGVTINDTYQTVWNEIWYDTVIEHTEGSSCNIHPTGTFNTGVSWPRYATQGGTNDWIMVRTHPNAVSDFPPFGMRTGPQYASKLATLVATAPGQPVAPGNPAQNFTGQIFDTQLGANHIWIENIAMTHASNPTLYPTGVADPPMFVNYVEFISGDCDFSGPTPQGCLISNTALTPDHIVIDRVYAYEQPWPARTMGCFYPGGTYPAIINTYCTTDFWNPAVYPYGSPIANGTTITVPYAYYQVNLLSGSPVGMTTASGYAGTSTSSLNIATGTQTLTTQAGLSWAPGDSIEIINASLTGPSQQGNIQQYLVATVTSYSGTSLVFNVSVPAGASGFGTYSKWNIVQPAVVTFSGAGSYSGAVEGWISPSGLNVAYQTSSGVSATCTNSPGCAVTTFSSPPAYPYSLVPYNGMFVFYGSFSSGVFTQSQAAGQTPAPSLSVQWRPMGMLVQPVQFFDYDNNFIQAIGQTVYNDSLGPGGPADVSFTHNFFYFPRTKMQAHPTWDGYGYTFRNVVESKQMQRWRVVGNIFDGAAAYQNGGSPMYIAGTYAGPYSKGVQDVLVQSNIMRHVSVGFAAAGGGTTLNDSQATLRTAVLNNIIIDLNRDLYTNGGSGFESGPLEAFPMLQDFNISNNTIGLTLGNAPQLFLFGGASNSGTSVMGEGLLFVNNVALVSTGGGDVFSTGGLSGGLSNFFPSPAVPNGVAVPAPAGTWQMYLDLDWIHTQASSITPSWVMGNNVVIGAQNNRLAPTSTSTVAWGTGAKTWTVSSGLTFAAGQAVEIFPSGIQFFPVVPGCVAYGTVTSYSGTSLAAAVNSAQGTCLGNYSTWTFLWVDQTSSQVSSMVSSLWPASDTTSVFPGTSGDPLSSHCPLGTTSLGARLACVGWSSTLNLAGGNPNPYTITPTVYNPGVMGANVTTVNQAVGIVQNVVLSTAATAIGLSYTAPDPRACSADVSPAGAGTWTRLADSGGAFSRSLLFTSLTAATAYDWRLMCYFDQQAAFEFLPSQVTSGTITTAASGTQTVYTTFTLPSGASDEVVSFAPIIGSPVSATCTVSPCAVTAPKGSNYPRTVTAKSSGGATVGVPSTVGVTVN